MQTIFLLMIVLGRIQFFVILHKTTIPVKSQEKYVVVDYLHLWTNYQHYVGTSLWIQTFLGLYLSRLTALKLELANIKRSFIEWLGISDLFVFHKNSFLEREHSGLREIFMFSKKFTKTRFNSITSGNVSKRRSKT